MLWKEINYLSDIKNISDKYIVKEDYDLSPEFNLC